MNVLVIGAAGKAGQLVVTEAVAAGHTVTALVHDDTDYHAPAGVHVVTGDATNHGTIAWAVKGEGAVIDAIGGHPLYLATHLEEEVAKVA